MDFQSGIQSISEDQLNSLFNGTEVVPATEQKPEASPTEVKQVAKPVEETTITGGIDDLLFDEIKEEKEEVKQVAEDKKEDKPEEKIEPTEEAESTDEEQINTVLKNTVSYLVDKGYFKDIENIENLEVNGDVYAELVTKQLDDKVSDLFDELVDSTGDYGKAIINHIKVGGNPDDIIDLFKEQKQIEKFDVSDKKDQNRIIKKYYSEVVGWKDSKIDSYINTLEGSEDGLEEEAKEIQGKYDELHQKQLDSIREQNEKAEREQKEAIKARKKEQQEYVTNLVKAIDTSEFDAKDKKLVKDSILRFDKKLPDGTPINSFFHKFYDIQKDPKAYTELIHFVMNKEGYDKKVQAKQQSEDVKKNWEWVKKNGAVSKKGAQQEEKPTPTTTKSGFDFGAIKR